MQNRFTATYLLLLLLLTIPTLLFGADSPKREFRGAWLHVVGDLKYYGRTPEEQRQLITRHLDNLADAGCNAIIFQVRPAADALYKSDLEPWSMYLTGKRGRAPEPMWDPMQFVLEESHKRGMEFHAWLNPYRVTLVGETLGADHPVNNGSERFFRYNNMVFFDPGVKENRDFINKVVKDILQRYDVDAIHIDDYFYPYPGKTPFNADAATYKKYGNGMPLNDWRRHNVDLLIEELHSTIKGTKPWVRFGVSPFGIWRNKKNDPRGSDTNGFENYSGLYADVLLWAQKGWIDYMAPQLYWELDHKQASSRKLVKWWNDNANGVDIYIGQDVKRTMDTPDAQTGEKSELGTKIRLSRELENIGGNVWWHGYWASDNYKGARDSLQYKYQAALALPPVYGNEKVKPAAPAKARIVKQDGKILLSWDKVLSGAQQRESDVVRYVIYEFYPGEKPDIEEPEAIIAITPATLLELGDNEEELRGRTYMVTSLDRLNRESAPVKVSF